jgi:thymidylate synthase (FAD)
MRHLHTTPFEMCELKLHIRVPMDTWRQWIRHRTANVNEYSTRYSVAIDSAQRTQANQWRKQSLKNKQGSDDYFEVITGKKLTEEEWSLQSKIRSVYNQRLELGVAREQARKELPLSTYTEAYWKIDLHNLLHFLYLRMDPSAQFEIRCYAEIIGNEIVSQWCPLTWEAFLDYRLHAQRFSRIDLEIIRCIESGHPKKAVAYAIERGLIDKSGVMKRNREREELEEKLKALNIKIPW